MSIAESVAARLRSPEFDQWMAGAARVGFCSKPVRLAGSSVTLDSRTGEVLREFSAASQPDGLTYTRCGNRRARLCESCSHEYKGDTWHMIMAGAAGGMKGVPETVSDHPHGVRDLDCSVVRRGALVDWFSPPRRLRTRESTRLLGQPSGRRRSAR